jgi:hypothetical protein
MLGFVQKLTARRLLSVIGLGTEFARCDLAVDIAIVLAGVGRSRDDNADIDPGYWFKDSIPKTPVR